MQRYCRERNDEGIPTIFPMSTTIRPATIHDIPEIIALERSVTNAAHWSAEQYESRIKNGCFLVAEFDDRFSGFICARALTGEWEIENVVVAEEFRRRGIAGELLNELFEAGQKSGCGSHVLHLEVRESNLAARQLYAKHGFLEVGRRPNYYCDPTEDAVLYTKIRIPLSPISAPR